MRAGSLRPEPGVGGWFEVAMERNIIEVDGKQWPTTCGPMGNLRSGQGAADTLQTRDPAFGGLRGLASPAWPLNNIVAFNCAPI